MIYRLAISGQHIRCLFRQISCSVLCAHPFFVREMEGKDGIEGKKRKLEDSNTPKITEEVAAKLLGHLTKEQLFDILKPAITNHPDILDQVRKITDLDLTLKKLFVRGIGYETTLESFKSVFAEHGEIVDAVVVTDKTTGKNKGYGFITYRHADCALSALEEPSKMIDGRMAVCNLAAAGQQQSQLSQLLQQPIQPVNPFQLQQHLLPSMVPVQPIQPANPFQPATTDPNLRRVYVGNVPEDMQPARMTNFFSRYGDIEEGPGGFDRQTGKSKGYSLILYKTIEGANRALEDPVKSIDGHQLFCKLAFEGQKQKVAANPGQAVTDLKDKVDINHVSQYGGLGHGLVNQPLIGHRNTVNPSSLPVTGLNPYGLSDAALPSLSRDPAATNLPYSSLNSSAQLDLGRQLLLQGAASGRASLGAGSYGLGPYGSSGYGSHSYSSFGGAASLYGISSSSSVAQNAAYDGASQYPLTSRQSQLPGTSPSSGLPGMRSFYTS